MERVENASLKIYWHKGEGWVMMEVEQDTSFERYYWF